MNYQDVARVTHEANRALQIIQGDPAPSPTWDEAPEWQRASALDGVLSVLDGASPRECHEGWVRFKLDDGWRYGATKDAEAKTHPCIVDYDDLPIEQRLKDDLFTTIVRTLGAHAGSAAAR